MKRKRVLHIGIAPREQIHQRMLAIASGACKLRSDDPRVWFTSAEALARVLSRKNMVLIEAIRREKPASVTELAQRVGRRKTNVLRSLKTLQQFEIVGFEDGEGGRKSPRINYDDFRIDGRLGDASRDWAA
jgi:predicted transcriptional regulator